MSDKFSELQPGSFIYTLPNALDADFCRQVIEPVSYTHLTLPTNREV